MLGLINAHNQSSMHMRQQTELSVCFAQIIAEGLE